MWCVQKSSSYTRMNKGISMHYRLSAVTDENEFSAFLTFKQILAYYILRIKIYISCLFSLSHYILCKNFLNSAIF